MKRSSLGGWLSFVVVLCIAALVYFNMQWVIDEANVLTYHPNGTILSIMKRDDLTSTGKFYFLASRPSIETSANFSTNCGQHEAGTAVLGCYTGQRIYLFNVTDNELDGIEEVTAAHEMLHAAYARLSPAKKDRVDAELVKEADVLMKDPAFSSRISVYSKLPTADYINELHSVIGTEVANPGSELENYYKTYFDDRAAIVAMHAQYQRVFTTLQVQANQLADSLNAQAAKINRESATYNSDAEVLQQDIETFNAQSSTRGGFATQTEFNQARQSLVTRVNQLNAERDSINQQVDAYNADKAKLNAMEVHLTTLNNSIDSDLSPAPRV